jgi:hypothetical protein
MMCISMFFKIEVRLVAHIYTNCQYLFQAMFLI